ncbi:ORF122 hypothetical protein [Orf virus]|uniref:Uncharacterized protein n=1 Tax=Orf virus TaxID=10258 RepID=Q6TVX8_ORFV|nr:ORF122 hypothetical protein [Orf virus]
MANRLVFLDPETLAEADGIPGYGVFEPGKKKCIFTKIRTSVALACRYAVSDGGLIDEFVMATYGTRRACRLVRHLTISAEGVMTRPASNCAPHMVLICLRGVAAVSSEDMGFGRCIMERGTMFMVKSAHSAVVCGNPACELLVLFYDYFTPIPRPLSGDEVLFTRDLAHVDYAPESAVVFKMDYNLETDVATLFVGGYIFRAKGLMMETREQVGDECDCCRHSSPVLVMDREKMMSSLRMIPSIVPGQREICLRERGWAVLETDARGHCEPGVLRLALAGLRLFAGCLRSVVGRRELSLFCYGIAPKFGGEFEDAPRPMEIDG